MKNYRVISACCLALVFSLSYTALFAQTTNLDLAKIKPDVKNGFGNAGWCYDRYKDLKPLNAKTQIIVGDFKGPGVITHLHMTRHHPEKLMSRGVVLEIWFDDAKEPAVCCPVADFFGDGCNGKSQFFTSNLIECAPWSYNCYIPMPFKKRARVILRNDTDKKTACYAYAEWETLPKWDDSLGYFHATYQRECFQMTPKTDKLFFEVKGSGHLLGRQYSVVTDEPYFHKFCAVMEANNEVNIDGVERKLDYLGTEDSFTFSWGFQNQFAGLHAGMPYIKTSKELNELSVYRFHDYMPIRFNDSIQWRLNWSQERGFTKNPRWAKAVAEDGCWIDYATVYYWYQKDPGGYKHQPLRSCEDRQKVMLRHSKTAVKEPVKADKKAVEKKS